MGLDCRYQGIPSNLGLIELAFDNPEFADEVFYPVIAYAKIVENFHGYQAPKFAPLFRLFSECPSWKTWHYSPNSRMQEAVIFVLNPESFIESKSFEDLEKTMAYKIVKGDRVFSQHLRATQGMPVRVSYPAFVRKCVEFLESFDVTSISRNFDAAEMKKLHIYKISEFSELRNVEDYFFQLVEFYKRMASVENTAIFFIED